MYNRPCLLCHSSAEKAAAVKLKQLLADAGSNVDGILSLLKRYKDVAVRPQVALELAAERFERL